MTSPANAGDIAAPSGAANDSFDMRVGRALASGVGQARGHQPMTMSQFQAAALIGYGKAFFDGHIGGVPLTFYLAAAAAGEAGELANKVKKVFRDFAGATDAGQYGEIVDEMGDVLNYLTALAEVMGTTLESVAERNLAKLAERRARKAAESAPPEPGPEPVAKAAGPTRWWRTFLDFGR